MEISAQPVPEATVKNSPRQQPERESAADKRQNSLFAALMRLIVPAASLWHDKEKLDAALAQNAPPPEPEAAPPEERQERETAPQRAPGAERNPLRREPMPLQRPGFIELKLKPEQWLPSARREVEPGLPFTEGQQRLPLVQVQRLPAVAVVQARDIPQLLDGLSGRIRIMLQNGVQRAHLQLDPPELGRLALQIELNGAHLRVQLTAERAQVQEQLLLWLDQLRENLKLAGVEFEQVEVEVQTESGAEDDSYAEWLQEPIAAEETAGVDLDGYQARRFGYNSFEMVG